MTDEAVRAPITTPGAPLPRGTAVAVAGVPHQARVVRRVVRIRAGRPPREAELLDLLVTELFANAVRHSRSGDPGGEVVVSVSKDGRRTQVKVIDQGPKYGTFPHLQPLGVEHGEDDGNGEPGGFGLLLVREFASRWGVEIAPGRGTVVWFEVERHTRR